MESLRPAWGIHRDCNKKEGRKEGRMGERIEGRKGGRES